MRAGTQDHVSPGRITRPWCVDRLPPPHCSPRRRRHRPTAGAAYCTADLQQVGATYRTAASCRSRASRSASQESSTPSRARRCPPARSPRRSISSSWPSSRPGRRGRSASSARRRKGRRTVHHGVQPARVAVLVAGARPDGDRRHLVRRAQPRSFSRLAPPAGRFACWSTDESRETWPRTAGSPSRTRRPASSQEHGQRSAASVLPPSAHQRARPAAPCAGLPSAAAGCCGRCSGGSQSPARRRPSGGRPRGTAALPPARPSCIRSGPPTRTAASCRSRASRSASQDSSTPSPASAPTGTKAAEIHLELMAKLAAGPPRPIGVECQETTKGVARCTTEYNPFGTPLSAPEPAPSEIVGIWCAGHSHA